MEIENDASPNSAVEDLVSGLNAARGDGTYAFVDTGIVGTDEIRVALIYKPAAVTPVGAYQVIDGATDPRFLDTKNRPSLAQTFQRNANGARLTVVVNHLKSKGSACDDVGDPDTGDGQGNCNVPRTNAAKAIVDWLASDPTGSSDADFLLIGDMNSYTFEDPIAWFTSHGFTNLMRQFGGLDAYSYVVNGESGYLDHGLASSSLAAQATGATDWHINPDEPTVLDYNVEFKTANQIDALYDPGPYRASDHDPVVIGLNLNGPPSAGAGGPYEVGEGGSVAVSATASDPDGDALTYAWDQDDDRIFETSGQSTTFSAASIDGPSSRTIRVRATDAGGLAGTAQATVNIANVAPSAAITGPDAAQRGIGTSWQFSATDPASADQAAGFGFSIDWGDGSPAEAVSGTSPRAVGHTYSVLGGHTISVTATDKDGGVSLVATKLVTVFGALLQGDPCDAGKRALVVVGTAGADEIDLRSARGSAEIEVEIGTTSIGTFAPTGQMIVSALGGGDTISVEARIDRQRTLYGGAGTDTIQGGNGSGTLIGGAGADSLSSGNGRDILIGGADGDSLNGGNGDDIVVAGETTYDGQTAGNQQALCALLAEWSRADIAYAGRIAHLDGTSPGGLNGATLLEAGSPGRTVLDDGAVDSLVGGSGLDWFLLNVVGGTVDGSDRSGSEVATDLEL